MTSTHYDSLIGYLQISRGTFTLTVWESSQLYSTIVQVSVCIHFTIFFSIYFHCSASIPYRGQKANRLYQGRKFPGTFVPRSESSREPSFLGAKVPTGNFRSEERKYRGAKSPDTPEPHPLDACSAWILTRAFNTLAWTFQTLQWNDATGSLADCCMSIVHGWLNGRSRLSASFTLSAGLL